MDADYNTRIKLASVVQGDKEEIERLVQLLSIRGWCFVEFDADVIKEYENLFTAVSAFFSSPEEHRKLFKYNRSFGYVTTAAKHGFHVLTGKRLEELPIPFPMYNCLRRLAVSANTLSTKVIEVAGPKLFAQKESYQQELSKKIPLVTGHTHSGIRTEYGMLDIMEYFVPKADAETSNATSVSEHGDPGLFSFSFKSNQPGLSMLDPVTNTWVPVPPSVSVMWCGSAAEEISSGLLKVGWHRVDKTFTQPRLTMWYEVCTYEQVPQQFQQNDIGPCQEEVADRPVVNYPLVTVKTLTGKVIEFTNSGLNSNSTIMDLQEMIQDKEGIPPSKMRLMCMARVLASDRTFGFYGYEPGQMIYLVLALRG